MELPAGKSVRDSILDHPKFAAFLAFLALAATFSPRVSAMASWICILIGWVFGALTIWSLSSLRRSRFLASTLSLVLAAGLVVYGEWLTASRTERQQPGPQVASPQQAPPSVGPEENGPAAPLVTQEKPSEKTLKRKPLPPSDSRGSVGGSITQGPCSNLQIGGRDNQATIDNCQVANPNRPVVSYDFDGTRRAIPVPGHLEIDEAEVATFETMRGYINAREWRMLADLAEETMKRVPDWPTPYFAAGEAYNCLHDQTKSIQYLKYFKEKADGGVTYAGAVSDSDKILNHATVQDCNSKE